MVSDMSCLSSKACLSVHLRQGVTVHQQCHDCKRAKPPTAIQVKLIWPAMTPSCKNLQIVVCKSSCIRCRNYDRPPAWFYMSSNQLHQRSILYPSKRDIVTASNTKQYQYSADDSVCCQILQTLLSLQNMTTRSGLSMNSRKIISRTGSGKSAMTA